ncbi:MAG: nucleotide exchange factor GrpE [Lactobacillus sp.]|jgi:molecular chaperone GrpE|nr:nucleotide exchange factor GrpE [Lactobacillus sp.]
MKKDKKSTKDSIDDLTEEEFIENEAEEDAEIEEAAPLEDIEEKDPFEVLELLKTENVKLKEDVLRAYADAENTKKRAAQEIEKNNKYAISSFAKNLLTVADNLDRAIQSASANKECESLLKGVELTKNELIRIFEKFGIQKMEIVGQHFDPNFHQVVQEVEDKDKPAGTIVNELQTGYMINDRILREAMVIVSK